MSQHDRPGVRESSTSGAAGAVRGQAGAAPCESGYAPALPDPERRARCPPETRNDVFAPMASPILRASSEDATDALVLAHGTRLLLRPLCSEDRDGLAAAFARLSPESRRRRFLSPKHELTPQELAFFTDIDHVGHEAIVALDQRDGSIVGVGRYVQVADRAGVAEVAVVVADELQSIGIGTALARRTVWRARVNGFTLLTATTLWENRLARALARCLGFRARASHGSEIELELALELRRATSPRRRTDTGSRPSYAREPDSSTPTAG
jgi:GNAT superfamily N-acetyltransferase